MSRNTALRVVSLTQSSGVELNAYLVLDEKPARIDQKLKTLSEYVQQYPSGWKKRLELANLLYEMGHIEQAVEEYRQVIDRQQPPSIGVRLQLGKLLQLMGQKAEAVAVYESALANARNEATRQHIRGSHSVEMTLKPGYSLLSRRQPLNQIMRLTGWRWGRCKGGEGMRLQLGEPLIRFCH